LLPEAVEFASPDVPLRTFIAAPVAAPPTEAPAAAAGEYNDTTSEWADGLASAIIRNAAANASDDCSWVVFDGPVDAIWIESMNTGVQGDGALIVPTRPHSCSCWPRAERQHG
jgi:hypothetical protein